MGLVLSAGHPRRDLNAEGEVDVIPEGWERFVCAVL